MSFNLSTLVERVISDILLSSKPCRKVLEFDGISSKNFLLRDYDNKVLVNCKDAKTLKNQIPMIGISFTIIKNLDEYQFIICNYIPGISDTNVFKIKFQKIRILIFLFMCKLTKIMMELDKNAHLLDELNALGRSLVLEVSELVLEYRESLNNTSLAVSSKMTDYIQKINLKRDYFENFQLNEKKINDRLFSIYGIECDE